MIKLAYYTAGTAAYIGLAVYIAAGLIRRQLDREWRFHTQGVPWYVLERGE